MRGIRIGKDVALRWEILTGGEALPLEGRDLVLELRDRYSRHELPFTTDGNVLTAVWRGTEQRYLGAVRLTLWENKGKPGQTAVDLCDAFRLVRCTCDETPPEPGSLGMSPIDLGTSGFDASPGSGECGCEVSTPADVIRMWEDIIGKE